MALAARSSVARPTVAAKAARGSVRVMAASRPLWLPGADVPAHLDGTYVFSAGLDAMGAERAK